MILTVILTILKIIGIILASIIGFVLLVSLLLLFVPFRYNIKAFRTGEPDDPPVNAKGYVSWLLHFVHVGVKYPSDSYVTIRLLGIPILRIPNNKKESSKDETVKNKKEKNKKEKNKKVKENTDSVYTEESKSDDVSDNIDSAEEIFDQEAVAEIEEKENERDPAQEIEDYESEQYGESKEAKNSIFSRLSQMINSIKCTIASLYDKIKYLFSNAKDKNDNIKKNIHYYHSLLTSDLFERTFAKTKKKVFKLLKSLLPKNFEVYAEVGFDDPYTTGEILAIVSALYPILGDHVKVKANFEEVIIKGAIKIKGRIYGISFVILGLYFVFNRDFRRLVRLLKKEDKKRGRKQ